jgi:sec-independent protein translocase protein TatA
MAEGVNHMWLLEDLSLPKVLFILAIFLLFFGPKRLPELGSSLGTAIRGFKQGLVGKTDEVAPATAKSSDAQ